MLDNALALLLGFLLDLLIGDPPSWPHLVRCYGKVISALEARLYPMKNKLLGGALLVCCELVVCTGVPLLILSLARLIGRVPYLVLASLLVWQCLAAKSLAVESRRVYDALNSGTLDDAQHAVSMIVGRDTDVLDADGVTRAAVETVAENASDGEIAPLFWMLLLGPVGGAFYKAVNTMDSMIGYKNDRYLLFGRCAAKLDDVLNFLPSRLAALLLIAAAHLCGEDGKNAWRIWRRDRKNHASPNSAQTESAVAGALRLRLAGNAQYFGVVHEKPYIGDDLRPIEPNDILRAHRLLYVASTLMLLICLIGRICIDA